MSYGYLITVGLMAVLTVFGVWAPRRPRLLAHATFWLGMVIREVPGYALAWMVYSTWLSWSHGTLARPVNWPALAIAVLNCVGLVVIGVRGFAARRVLDAALRPVEEAARRAGRRLERRRWPSAVRGLLFPFPVAGLGVRRIRSLPYGSDRRQRLDVWLPRSRPPHPDRPVLVYLHGGGYYSSSRRRTAQHLLARFARDGWVCVTAGYRLRPQVELDGHLADAQAAIAWARAHAEEYGADPGPVVLVGSSAGAHLGSIIALTGDRVAAVVGYYGYYGEYYGEAGGAEHSPSSPISLVHDGAPPFLVVDAAHDTYVPLELPARFVARLRSAAASPVVRVVLPGAQHNFDLLASVRFGAVVTATARFLDAAGVSGTATE